MHGLSYANKGCRTHALLRHLVGAILFVEDFVVDVVPVAGEGLLDGVEAAVSPLMGSAAILYYGLSFVFGCIKDRLSADGRASCAILPPLSGGWEPPLPGTPRGYPGNVGNTGIPGKKSRKESISSGHFAQNLVFWSMCWSTLLYKDDTVASFFYFQQFERSNGWMPSCPIRS